MLNQSWFRQCIIIKNEENPSFHSSHCTHHLNCTKQHLHSHFWIRSQIRCCFLELFGQCHMEQRHHSLNCTNRLWPSYCYRWCHGNCWSQYSSVWRCRRFWWIGLWFHQCCACPSRRLHKHQHFGQRRLFLSKCR